MKPPSEENPKSSVWPRTDWTGLGRAAQAVGTNAEQLESLILKYRPPMKIWLVATFPPLSDQADELLQDFAQDKILKAGWLGKADQERGRFRDFLKTSLRNFIHDYLRRTAKSPVSLDSLELDPPAEDHQADPFELIWARAILAEAKTRMEEDCRNPGKDQPRRARVWEVFRLRVLEPNLEGSKEMPYEELVARFEIESPTQAQNMLATGKRIFDRHLHAVIADYERGGEAVKAELADLKRFLARLSGKKS